MEKKNKLLGFIIGPFLYISLAYIYIFYFIHTIFKPFLFLRYFTLKVVEPIILNLRYVISRIEEKALEEARGHSACWVIIPSGSSQLITVCSNRENGEVCSKIYKIMGERCIFSMLLCD